MRAELKKIRKNYVKFIGKKTPWDVSLVDREFGHKNNEAMMVNWGDRDRRFYFFHHARLWKVFIAFNATLYRGKTFNDFAAAMERVFGRAERKFKTNLKGEAEMSHLEWPAARKTKLIAIDQTAFYGNFCLVLTHLPAAKRVKAGRKDNSPKKNYRDPLVRAVTSKNRPGSTTDPNADIVDQLTGRGVKAPKRSDTPSRTTAPTPRKKKKKKKISTKDPLKDLDI